MKALSVPLALAISSGVAAQELEEIVVVGVVPAGSSIDTDKLAYPVQTATNADLKNISAVSIADFLKQSFSSISLNEAQNNPLQPDLQYRGFTASPLLGLAQGLAVYQNGIRINEPLGDAVNWDLLPQSAIQELSLGGGANPLYGLNSLGGSIVIDMKDGFDFEARTLKLVQAHLADIQQTWNLVATTESWPTTPILNILKKMVGVITLTLKQSIFTVVSAIVQTTRKSI